MHKLAEKMSSSNQTSDISTQIVRSDMDPSGPWSNTVETGEEYHHPMARVEEHKTDQKHAFFVDFYYLIFLGPMGNLLNDLVLDDKSHWAISNAQYIVACCACYPSKHERSDRIIPE